MRIFVQMKGVEELKRRIRKVTMELSPAQVEPLLLQAGETMAMAIRSRAPQGPAGNLKRAVVVKRGKNSGKRITVMVAIDRKIAPHAHLVERGTKARFTKAGKYTGVMPAHPFFRPAVDAQAPKTARWIRAGIKKLVEEAAVK